MNGLLFDAAQHVGVLAMAAARAFPRWKRSVCQQYGLTAGTVDTAHYARSAGRPFSSAEEAAFHYLTMGSARDWSPQAGFSPADYRRDNPDTVLAGYEPFAHWLRFGRAEGRCTMAPVDPLVPDMRGLSKRGRPEGTRATVDVIVPVYGGRSLTLQAIASVLEAPTREVYELVVVDDASPDGLLRGELEALARAGLVTLLVNDRNIGFVGSVNRGMALHPGRDVVLLNSDARVYGDWLDRLMAALRTPKTGTATPFSNAATILSYPATLRENRLPADGDAVQWDRLCAAIDPPLVDIPTAVGFCMAIRRSCLQQIGPFDQERFGRGYGEENDFCLRATAAGWRHVAVPGLFVWHCGGTSFGEQRRELIAAAQVTIEALHPGYAAAVGRFIREDPLEPARRALDIARVRSDPRPKRLRLGATGVTGTPDAIDIDLVPDLPPYAGQYRLVATGIGATPNLPRCGPSVSSPELARLFEELGIQQFEDRGGAATAAWGGRVRRALQLIGAA